MTPSSGSTDATAQDDDQARSSAWPRRPVPLPLRSSCRPCAGAAHHFGINADTIARMAMTLRLTDDEADALRARARLEGRSMQEVARAAVRDYIERTSARELVDQVLDEELPCYAEALRRLGR